MTYRKPVLTIAVTNETIVKPFYFQQLNIGKNVSFNEGDAQKLLQAAKHCGFNKIRLIGGEPFIKPKIMELFLNELFNSDGTLESIEIYTHGAIPLSGTIWNLIKQLSLKINLIINLDTLDNELYIKIYGDDKLNQVLNTIHEARSQNINVTIQSIITTLNKKNIEDIITYAQKETCNLTFEDLKSARGDDEFGDLYCNLDDIRQIISSRRLEFSGISTASGGFGIPCFQWRLTPETLITLRDSSEGAVLAPLCAFTTCKCYNGGFPLLLTPDMSVHICNNDKYIIALGSEPSETLHRILNGFRGPTYERITKEDEVMRQGGIPTGSHLQKILDPIKHQFHPSQFDGDSIDLRLDEKYRMLRRIRLYSLFKRKIDPWTLSILDEKKIKYIWPLRTMPPEGIWLKPGHILHAVSKEEVIIPKGYIGFVLGRTTWARLGLSVCSDFAKLQTGRRGWVQFQIVNNGEVPIRLLPRMYIAQLIYMPITDDYTLPGPQYLADGVYPPIREFSIEREILPSLMYLLNKKEGHLAVTSSTIPAFKQGEIIKLAEEHHLIKKFHKQTSLSINKINLILVLASSIIGIVGTFLSEIIIKTLYPEPNTPHPPMFLPVVIGIILFLMFSIISIAVIKKGGEN